VTKRKPLQSTESVPLLVPPTQGENLRGRLLIVDHAPAVCVELAAYFQARGWQVACAADMKGAIEIAMAIQPDAIITELELRDVHGLHFVRALRSAVEHDIVILGVTTLPERVGAPGFERVFVKPAPASELEAALDAKRR